MLKAVEQKALQTAKRGALGLVGTILLIVGLVFLTGAAWMWLVLVSSWIMAALIIGGFYSGLGCIFLAFASRSGNNADTRDTEQNTPDNPWEAMLAAFMNGMEAGSAMKKRRK